MAKLHRIRVPGGIRRGLCLSVHATVTRRTATLAFASRLAICVLAGMAADPSPIAIQGYDPVAYFTLQRATPGVAQFEYDWDEHRWQFSSAQHRDLFKADPVRYAPQFANFCAVALARGEVLRSQSRVLADQRRQALSFRQAERARPVSPGSAAEHRTRQPATARCCRRLARIGRAAPPCASLRAGWQDLSD